MSDPLEKKQKLSIVQVSISKTPGLRKPLMQRGGDYMVSHTKVEKPELSPAKVNLLHLETGDTVVTGIVPSRGTPPPHTHVSFCVSDSAPTEACTDGKFVSLENRTSDPKRDSDYIDVWSDTGEFTANFSHAPEEGQFVTTVERLVDEFQKPTPFPQPVTVSAKEQPGAGDFLRVAPLSVAIAGVDISGASSTNARAVYLAAAIMDLPLTRLIESGEALDIRSTNWWATGVLRVAGIAQPTALVGQVGNVGAAASYLGTAINSTPDKIVQSIEANVSGSYMWKYFQPEIGTFNLGTFRKSEDEERPSTLITLAAIAGLGATTPLSISQLNPPVYYLTQQIVASAAPNTLKPADACKVASANPTCFVSFIPTDRTRFYRHYEAGLRVKIYGSDYDKHQLRFPGMADITLGQNEYVTGGRLHGLVLHIGGSMPLPVYDGIYIFGSMDAGLAFGHDDQPQLLLTPAPSDAMLTYLSPSIYTINVNQQPNRDRYRIGLGVDIFKLLSAAKSKGNTGNVAPAAAGTK